MEHQQKVFGHVFLLSLFGLVGVMALVMGLYLVFAQDQAVRARLFADQSAAYFLDVRQKGDQDSSSRSLLDEAYSSLEQAVFLTPYDPFLWVRMGYVSALRDGDLVRSDQALRVALKLQPGSDKDIARHRQLIEKLLEDYGSR